MSAQVRDPHPAAGGGAGRVRWHRAAAHSTTSRTQSPPAARWRRARARWARPSANSSARSNSPRPRCAWDAPIAARSNSSDCRAANARIAMLAVQAEELSQRINLHLALGGSFETRRHRRRSESPCRCATPSSSRAARCGALFFQRCFYLFVLLLALIASRPSSKARAAATCWPGFNAFIVLSAAAAVGRTASVFSAGVRADRRAPWRCASRRWKTGTPRCSTGRCCCTCAVYVDVIALLLRYVFGPEVMDADRLWGAAAAYLMIGILWCFLYATRPRFRNAPSFLVRGEPAKPRSSPTCCTSASRR